MDDSMIREALPPSIYMTVRNSGIELTELAAMTPEQIAASIKGVGPTNARRIHAVLTEWSNQPPGDDAKFDSVIHALRMVGRYNDAANLQSSRSSTQDKIETGLAILENLQPGALGRNLAQSIRDA